MLEIGLTTARHYMHCYQQYAADFWGHMTPMQYGSILIGVAVIGVILMKSSR